MGCMTRSQNASQIPVRHSMARFGARTATTRKTNLGIQLNTSPTSSAPCPTLRDRLRFVSITKSRIIRHGDSRTDRKRPASNHFKRSPKKPVVPCRPVRITNIHDSSCSKRHQYSLPSYCSCRYLGYFSLRASHDIASRPRLGQTRQRIFR